MLPTRTLALLGAAVLVSFTAQVFAEHGRTPGAFNVSGGSATYT
jgi:hypothetical protein